MRDMRDMRDPQEVGDYLLDRQSGVSVLKRADDLPGYILRNYGETPAEYIARVNLKTPSKNGLKPQGE